MSSELLGKWYVYRYNLANPVLKSPETSLEVTRENNAYQARFELKGQSKSVEITMTRPDAKSSDWHGETGTLDFQWAQVEPGVLTGQIFDRSNPEENRDFFVAVRTQRTEPLPTRNVYTFTESYNTPYKTPSGKGDEISVHLDTKEIRFDGMTYKIGAKPRAYRGGLMLTGRPRQRGLTPQALRLWILPVDKNGHLLATGYYEYHREFNTGSSRPECQMGKTGIAPG